MAENIYLIGFMGSGKSTVSRYLKEAYEMKRIEMDEQIELEEGMGIPEIFSQKGESYFRELETALLKRIAEGSRAVVSCGGGTALRAQNIEIMKQSGKIVFLSATPETIYERVKDFHTRPLLEKNMNVDYIRELLETRISRYEAAADFVISTDHRTAEEIGRDIFMQACYNSDRMI